MLLKQPSWVTHELGPEGERFFVVQERQLPPRFAFWHGDVRRRIFERGDFPWREVVFDLPGAHFGSLGGDLPQRAVSCRFVDRAITYLDAEPIRGDPLERLDGEGNLHVTMRGLPRMAGRPQIVVPHTGHRVVRVAWCSSIEIDCRPWLMTPNEERRYPGALAFRPHFVHETPIARYVFAFWEVAIA